MKASNSCNIHVGIRPLLCTIIFKVILNANPLVDQNLFKKKISEKISPTHLSVGLVYEAQ